jgi:hypothetical protein
MTPWIGMTLGVRTEKHKIAGLMTSDLHSDFDLWKKDQMDWNVHLWGYSMSEG